MKTTFVLLTLLVLLLAFPVTVLAQSDPAPDPAPALGEVSDFIAALGLGGAVAVAVQALKQFGLIPDGASGTVATVINVVLFAALVIVGAFGLDLEGDTSTAIFSIIAQLANLGGAILSSFGTYKGLRAGQVKGFKPNG